MRELPNVTMVCIDTVNYGEAVSAIQKSLKEINPARTIFFTDIDMVIPDVEIIRIPHIYKKKDYSDWMMKELGKQEIHTSHILVIQHDGYILDGEMWTDEFLNYDYIGAPWLESDGFNVGNGGCSLRSFKLHMALAHDDLIMGIQPEDVGICRIYRDYLEQKEGFKWAPDTLAHRFSYELHEPKDKTFGFHGKFHPQYVEPIAIIRTAALGDVIQVEPVLEYFHSLGHPVYLGTLPGFYDLFATHYFPVGNYASFDKTVIKHRVINLDLAYESKPAQLHLKSYFEYAGIKDYKLRNPKLHYVIDDRNRFFKKYVVLHIDERETTHRNIFDIDWRRIRVYLEDKGYTVIQIGKGYHEKVGLEFNCLNERVMMWLIAGASGFIGIDSGPATIAIALKIKSIVFFGSVNPEYIHPDLHDVQVIQSKCPINKQHCWHSEPSTTGVLCEVNAEKPPCCMHSTNNVINAIDKML